MEYIIFLFSVFPSDSEMPEVQTDTSKKSRFLSSEVLIAKVESVLEILFLDIKITNKTNKTNNVKKRFFYLTVRVIRHIQNNAFI